jgi:SAM-dependent methyltransferase
MLELQLRPQRAAKGRDGSQVASRGVEPTGPRTVSGVGFFEQMSVDPVAHNRIAWDRQVDEGNEWSRPISPETVARARAGEWSVVLIGYQPVERSWFPAEMAGVDVLCLASGGGQQGPTLAAAGARVTVFDNSPRQLDQDELVARRDDVPLRTVLGDMRDLSVFADSSFDLVFNPVSNLFVPELAPVWRECFRVLRPGGALLCGFLNPDVYLFDHEALDERGELVVRHRLPYSDVTHVPAEERDRMYGVGAPLEYSHSMAGQIGGQLAAGFVITGFEEAPHHADATAGWLPGYFATRAVKPAES